jgi:hypothetical protein
MNVCKIIKIVLYDTSNVCGLHLNVYGLFYIQDDISVMDFMECLINWIELNYTTVINIVLLNVIDRYSLVILTLMELKINLN